MQLGVWERTIVRGVGATSLHFVDGENGEFTLRAMWKTPDGDRTHDRTFTRAFVFGHTVSGSPLAYRVQKRACDYAKEFMREILAQRGALR